MYNLPDVALCTDIDRFLNFVLKNIKFENQSVYNAVYLHVSSSKYIRHTFKSKTTSNKI